MILMDFRLTFDSDVHASNMHTQCIAITNNATMLIGEYILKLGIVLSNT